MQVKDLMVSTLQISGGAFIVAQPALSALKNAPPEI